MKLLKIPKIYSKISLVKVYSKMIPKKINPKKEKSARREKEGRV